MSKKARDLKFLKLLGIDTDEVKKPAKLIEWMQENGVKFDAGYLESFPPDERARLQDILSKADLLLRH
jgi:hypothetical protein